MWRIRQNGNRWEVLNPAGEVVGDPLATYGAAVGIIASALVALTAAGEPSPGLLDETWVSPISTLSEPTGDGRDFTDCTWTWRDPATSTLPLMLQTETDFGHFGAVLAGYIETVATGAEGSSGGTNTAGRFYDSDAGRQFRDMLLAGRRFGVSADPGPGTEAEFHCTEFEDDGWCLDGDMVFTAYEVIGLTGTPFPGFATAYITLADPNAAPAADTPVEGADAGPAAAVASSADLVAAIVAAGGPANELAIPLHPPRRWYEIPEPQLGQRGMLDVYGMPVEELLIQQDDGNYAVPLTILNDGRVFGNIARWGQCHVGRLDVCVQPPESMRAYADFHVGATELEDGSQLATGNLVMGMDHPDLALSWVQARDAYAHHGLGWASVRVTNGEWGPWASGSLRPDVTPQQLQILRQLTLSGDWRSIDGGPLELIGTLAVNVPGFPIAREAIAASGWEQGPTSAKLGVRMIGAGSEPTAIVASGLVTRCPECSRRQALARERQSIETTGTELGTEVVTLLRTLERRTRHLVPEAVAAAAAAIPRRG